MSKGHLVAHLVTSNTLRLDGANCLLPVDGIQCKSAVRKDRQSTPVRSKQFAKRLRKMFVGEISSDPRAFKKSVIEILRRHLPPFAGRPTEESVTVAAMLRMQGRDWPEVYRLVIPAYAHLDPGTRGQAQSNLRSAIRSRRNARKRRKPRMKLIAETTREEDISLSQGRHPQVALVHGATQGPNTSTTPIPQR